MQVWSRAPVSNKHSPVWCVVNEQEQDPEGETGQTHTALHRHGSGRLSFFSSFLWPSPASWITRTPLAPRWQVQPKTHIQANRQTPSLHPSMPLLSLWEVKATKPTHSVTPSHSNEKQLWDSNFQLILITLRNLFRLGVILIDTMTAADRHSYSSYRLL